MDVTSSVTPNAVQKRTSPSDHNLTLYAFAPRPESDASATPTRIQPPWLMMETLNSLGPTDDHAVFPTEITPSPAVFRRHSMRLAVNVRCDATIRSEQKNGLG